MVDPKVFVRFSAPNNGTSSDVSELAHVSLKDLCVNLEASTLAVDSQVCANWLYPLPPHCVFRLKRGYSHPRFAFIGHPESTGGDTGPPRVTSPLALLSAPFDHDPGDFLLKKKIEHDPAPRT